MSRVQEGRRGTAAAVLPSAAPRGTDEVKLKLLCVGQRSAGKTTFLKFWETNAPHPSLKVTMGLEFHKQEMDVYLPPANQVGPFSSPQQGLSEDLGTSTSMMTMGSSSTALAREGSGVVSNGDSPDLRRSGSAMAPFRLTKPVARTQFGPGTECRRAIVQVWDVQGQEYSKSMTRVFYQSAMGALVFCDLATPESLDSAIGWKQDIDAKVRVQRADGGGELLLPCWLVVNKYDVIKDLPPAQCPQWATRQLLDQFVAEHGFVGWSYAAGLKGINVQETVSALVSRCVEHFPEEIRKLAATPAPQQRTRKEKPKSNNCCMRN